MPMVGSRATTLVSAHHAPTHFFGNKNIATRALSTATRTSISHFSHPRLAGLLPPLMSMCGAPGVEVVVGREREVCVSGTRRDAAALGLPASVVTELLLGLGTGAEVGVTTMSRNSG